MKTKDYEMEKEKLLRRCQKFIERTKKLEEEYKRWLKGSEYENKK